MLNTSSMSVQHITQLLEFCLDSTFFPKDSIANKGKGVQPLGSSVCPVVANLYTCTWEEFENKALGTAENPTRVWKRDIDDTFVI